MAIETGLIYRGDCYTILRRQFPDSCIDLIYVDPPFSFDPKYARVWLDPETARNFEKLREGGPKKYIEYMSRRIGQCWRVLKETGSMYLHCDWRFNSDLRLEMNRIFGRNNFQNELVWHYRGGGISKKRFGRKHDTIYFYTKSSAGIHTFNVDEIRQPYSQASLDRLRYEARAFRGKKVYEGYRPHPLGKHPDDVLPIQPTMPSSKERTGWLSQKPVALLEVIVKASSNPGNIVLDPMCGCGTTIVAAHKLGRRWIGIDISSQACEVMKGRMGGLEGITEVKVIGLPLTTSDLKSLGPFEFQDYICEMTNSVKTTHVADEGIDGYHLGETPLQVKQQKSVGRRVVDEFETALRRKGKNEGYIIAFSFTGGAKGAYEEAARAKDDGLTIRLVRVDELILNDYELEALLE